MFDGVNYSGINKKTDCAANTSYTGYVRVAAKTGFNASPVTSDTRTTSMVTVAAPAISPASTSFSGSQTVTLTCGTAGAVIYYTTDGSTPNNGSTPYNAPFTVSATTTVKAIAVVVGMNNSAIATATYTLNSSGDGTSGDSGSIGSGLSGGSTPSTPITTETLPNMPTIATASITCTVKDGVLTTTITEKMAKI